MADVAAADSVLSADELRGSARELLARHRLSKADPSQQWADIVEAGWLGLGLPERNGGLGLPFELTALLYEELGRSPAAQPFVGASLGLALLSDVSAAPGPRGTRLATLVGAAVGGDAIVMTPTQPAALAPHGGAPVSMRLDLQPQAAAATHWLLPVEDAGPAVALLTLPHGGVSVVDAPCWDETRTVGDLVLEQVELDPDAIILRGEPAALALRGAAARFDLAMACDSIGGTDRILAQTLDYMGTRQQFGRAIASFQALKHRCADHATALAGARALARRAAREFTAGTGDWQASAALARLHAGSVYLQVTEDAVQLHGGIGFTWEHDCHVFLKRARLGEVLGATAAARKDALAPGLFRSIMASRPRKAYG